MIQIAHLRRAITIRETTRQIPTPNELRQRRRGPIPGLCAEFGWVDHRTHPRTHARGEVAHHLSRDAAVAGHHRRESDWPASVSAVATTWITAAAGAGCRWQGNPGCHPHTNDCAPAANAPTASARRCRTVRGSSAHTGRQHIQPAIEHRSISGPQLAPQIRHPVTRGEPSPHGGLRRLAGQPAQLPDRRHAPASRPLRSTCATTHSSSDTMPPTVHRSRPAARDR